MGIVVAVCAGAVLVIAGTSTAAMLVGPNNIKKNAVRAKHIKKNAVRAKQIKKNAVKPNHLSPATLALLGEGVQGPQGEKGDKGDKGDTPGFLVVTQNISVSSGSGGLSGLEAFRPRTPTGMRAGGPVSVTPPRLAAPQPSGCCVPT